MSTFYLDVVYAGRSLGTAVVDDPDIDSPEVAIDHFLQYVEVFVGDPR